jgi:hypothetical protein
MNDWLALVQALDGTMGAHVPGWSDRRDHDPGITTLEIVAYLAESLRLSHSSVEGGASAALILDALDGYDDREPIVVRVNGERWQRTGHPSTEALDGKAFDLDHDTGTVTFGNGERGRIPDPDSTISVRYRSEQGETAITVRSTWPLTAGDYRVSLREQGTVQMNAQATVARIWAGRTRPNYFSGRLLTASDFTEEQQYHLAKHRRHLQTLHGAGIVSGLEVAMASGTSTITVKPGLAIDKQGREVQLDETHAASVLNSTQSPACLVIEYTERGIDPLPATAGDAEQFTRIEEGCRLLLVKEPCTDGVAIARLIREQNTWSLDPTFVPHRTR